MLIGVDYYPEQWDSSLWEKDAELMAQTGVKLVRLGEFAWSKFEPRDGEFVFSWLDDVLRIFARYGIDVVMGVPTNSPPLWLYKASPEITRVGADGKPVQIGIRGHRCVNSDVYLTYAKRVAERIVRHYSGNTQIVAWQIDNELDAFGCCCDDCKMKFRGWLMEKHGSLENINKAFGNSVWSLEYSELSEIDPPTAYPKEWQNPSLCLEYKRFCSESAAQFVKEIALIIKREIPKAKVTTNAFVSDDLPDIYKMYDGLDFVSFDNYPSINVPADKDEFYSNAFYLDMMRCVKGRKFWVMEQLSGPTGGWATMSRTTRPGQIAGYSMQAIAHGADTIMHFRWRTALSGAETFCHGLIDHSNVPGRRFFEFAELCKTMNKLSNIDATEIISDIAIIYSPENEWAFQIQPQTEGFYYQEQLKYFHKAFSRYGANVDIVSAESDLSKYKIVVAPAMFVYKKSAAENVYRYAINGGTLVLTNRSGVKDQNNNCVMEQLPSVFKELIGAEITEYDPIGNYNQTIVDFAGNRFSCSQWCDILNLTTAKSYAQYDDDFYRCCPAVTMNRYCGGVVYYVGTICEMDFYESFAGNIMLQTGIPKLNGLPEGVEVTTRSNGLDDFIIFFNNSDEEAEISLPKAMYSLIDSVGKDRLVLKPFGFDIVRK